MSTEETTFSDLLSASFHKKTLTAVLLTEASWKSILDQAELASQAIERAKNLGPEFSTLVAFQQGRYEALRSIGDILIQNSSPLQITRNDSKGQFDFIIPSNLR